jgi:hypothetical protein
MEQIKRSIKETLATSFDITHSTLEFEVDGAVDEHDTAAVPVH